jgi:hypothetical protein
MANETTYDIKIDAADAQAKMDKLVQSLKEAKKYVDSIGAGFRDIGKFNTPIPGFGNSGASNDNSGGSSVNNELDTRHKRGELEHFKDFKDYNKAFKPYAAEMKQFTRGVMGLGTNLLKLAAGGALGAAGGFFGGVMPLAKSAVEDRKMALSLGGANIGKMKSAGNAFGNILNVPDIVGKISQGQFDITSPQYLGLKMLGFSDAEIQGSDPSDLMAKAMGREQKRVKGYRDTQTAITMETARGGTSIFSPGDIKSLRALPTGELENRQKQYVDTQKDLDLTQKEQQAIDELSRKVGLAGDEIETVFTKNLAKMAPYMGQFTDAVTDFVVHKIPHDEGGVIKEVGENTLKDMIIPLYKWVFGGDKDKGSSSSWEKSFIETFDKGWENLFGHPTDTWSPFFNNLEKDWKSFFDKMSGTLGVNSALAGGIGTDSVGHPGWTGGRGGPPGSLTGPGRSPTGRRGGIFTGRAPDVQGTAANKDLPPEARAMLDIITANEASPPGNYNSGDADPNSFGGRYQDLNSTWNLWAKAGGFDPKDSSPANQDRVNWFGAQKDFRAATGKDLLAELKAGNVENASSVLGSTWHGLQKSSSAQWKILYAKKLKEEAAAKAEAAAAAAAVVPKLPAGLVPKSNIHQPDAYQGGTSGQSSEYPSPTEKGGPVSMSNMSHFQQDKKLALRIDNPAGANYAVSSGMLGSANGNYS